MKKSIRNIRSLLVVPSISKRNLEKTLSLNDNDKPDAIIFDLEDSVAPQNKSRARKTLEDFVTENREQLDSLYTIVIRINAISTKDYSEDIALMKKLRPDSIGPSKVVSQAEITKAKEQSGIKNVFIPIETIESAVNYKEFINTLTPNDGILIGYEDLSTDLGIKRPPLNETNPLSFIMLQSLVYARMRGVTFFDAVYAGYTTEIHLQGLQDEASYTKSLGMQGKVCIHPTQVSVVNEVFDKTTEKQEAKQVLKQIENKNEKSVVGLENELIGPPMIKYYERLLED